MDTNVNSTVACPLAAGGMDPFGAELRDKFSTPRR